MRRDGIVLPLLVAALGCGDSPPTDSVGDSSLPRTTGAASSRREPRGDEKVGTTGKTLLALRLEEGQTFVLQSTTQQTVTKTVDNRELTVHQTVVLHKRQTVESVESDGVTIIDVEFLRVKLNEVTAQGKRVYDSDNPPEGPPPPTPFASLAGRHYTKHVATDGSIVKLEGVDRLLDEMFETNPADAGPTRKLYRELVRSYFDAAGIEDMEQIATPIFPPREVGTGDVWMNRIVIGSVMPAVLVQTYEVVRRSGGKTIISVKTDVEPNDEADPVLSGPDAKLVLSGRQTGMLTVDEKTGLTIAKTVHQDLSGKSSVESPDHRKARDTPITVRGTTKLEIVLDPSTDE